MAFKAIPLFKFVGTVSLGLLTVCLPSILPTPMPILGGKHVNRAAAASRR